MSMCCCACMFVCEDTCHGEYSEGTVPPDFVLTQQKGEEHEEASVVNHPPDVNVALHPVLIAGEPVDAFGHQHCQFSPGCHTDALWRHTSHTHTESKHPVVVTALHDGYITYEKLPGFLFPPSIRPGNDHSVVFHASQSSTLNANTHTLTACHVPLTWSYA